MNPRLSAAEISGFLERVLLPRPKSLTLHRGRVELNRQGLGTRPPTGLRWPSRTSTTLA